MIITITCYNQTKTYKSKAAALKFYENCARSCEGSERDRYMSIVWQLEDGLTDIEDTNPDYFY